MGAADVTTIDLGRRTDNLPQMPTIPADFRRIATNRDRRQTGPTRARRMTRTFGP